MSKYWYYWCTFYPSSDDEVKVRFAGIAAERAERSIVHHVDALLQIAAVKSADVAEATTHDLATRLEKPHF